MALTILSLGSSVNAQNGDFLGLTYICRQDECLNDFHIDVQTYLGCDRVFTNIGHPTDFKNWQWPLQADINLVIGYGATLADLETADLAKFTGAYELQRVIKANPPGCTRVDRVHDAQSSVFISLFEFEQYDGLSAADESCLDTVRKLLTFSNPDCMSFFVYPPE